VEHDRAARMARAWTLHRDRWSLREIAAELGCSPETARSDIAAARVAEEWREVQERAGRVGRMTAFLNTLAARGVAALEGRPAGTLGDDDEGVEPQPYAMVVPALMKVVQEINRVEGNYAPTRVAVGDDRRAPDAELLAALEREARAAEDADAEDQRRELE
jgi:hypothetical protein